MKKAIVLAANYSYADQVRTTIKSVCYHNRDIKFYLINSDFPNEWFINLNKKLEKLNSEIVNARVDINQVNRYKTDISYTVFLRYFIPDFVEEDVALYLDCDLVVTKGLDELFSVELENYSLAAVKDLGGLNYYNEVIFNAGVMLVNNKKWKEDNTLQKLIDLTNEFHNKVSQADQSILNMLFKDNWLELDFSYNAITLHTNFAKYDILADDYPTIIHYLTERKPWKIYSQCVFREVWWFYNNLDFINIDGDVPELYKNMIVSNFEKTVLVYTYTDSLLNIDYLIRNLPKVKFVVAAPVVVSHNISRLLKYSNVEIASDIAVIRGFGSYLISISDILLDINYGGEVDNVVSLFAEQNKPVLAFKSMKHGEQGQVVFEDNTPEDMVNYIKSTLMKNI
ncbi:hypothetical protein HZY83_05025 [Gemella sp. GH3]|uniref:glycosyltransferase family 8 protein n=1 Tax=unclassified Gemella TaxID=2624949 RepID=UPI0015D0B42A|nr:MULTISPECIES: glycosyltransferase family 8 protein [unclassified Gemella]MBF0714042.1 hypothetical protein [Gemella sp. GH3.1]NYS50994.1 hypothetical protein [Gemella sp. GH3]